MDEAPNKIIYIIIGVVLSLLISGIAFGIYRSGKGGAQKANESINEFTIMLDESEYTDIEGSTILGNQVTSYLSQWANKEIALKVVLKNNTSTFYNYGDADRKNLIDANTNNTAISAAKSKSSTTYINPNGKFEVTLTRDTNSNITCITFSQQ